MISSPKQFLLPSQFDQLTGMLLITPVASFQDNQTDSGMVLASEEFERIENRHRKEGGFRYSLSLATQIFLLPNALRQEGALGSSL